VWVIDTKIIVRLLTADNALHVARAGDCSAFLSFDRNLVKRFKGITPLPVEMP
jgi:hypothetical protein